MKMFLEIAAEAELKVWMQPVRPIVVQDSTASMAV
jgi:hypothetical protein